MEWNVIREKPFPSLGGSPHFSGFYYFQALIISYEPTKEMVFMCSVYVQTFVSIKLVVIEVRG